ncbi:LytR/AlgR family response regulator transcription factor [Spirosoma soli]|uniref:LytR/AlgR family response regulator transcription factor n=1 Tax=Spirosoma soli TaxID=1770529 RepID=A0ABW5MEN9_9BACT
MLQSVRTFLNRPLAEDFSLSYVLRSSLQASVYVFLFISLLNLRVFNWGQIGGVALLGAGCFVSSLLANWLVPSLIPGWYDEERWTVGRHILHTLFVLLCISLMNQLLLTLTDSGKPAFWQMYLYVTLIGFFPITLGVLVAEQRRLKRNSEHAEQVNTQLTKFQETKPATSDIQAQALIHLTSENGKDRLSLHPDQLIYVESVGNYVDIYWLNLTALQKTILRNTLKDVEAILSDYPQFFRCHRAFVVNLKAIRKTEGNARGYQLTLNGVTSDIPVSRSYLEAFDQRMSTLS